MIRRYDGKDLLKVLVFYGLSQPDVNTTKFKIVCPFHGDVNASMQIDLSEGSFYCYGCGATGDAKTFVSMVNPELNELDSCIALEKIVRSDEIKALHIKCRKKKRVNNKSALTMAGSYYYGLRSVDWNTPRNEEEKQGLEYMQSRGFGVYALNKAHCKVTYDRFYPIVFPILDNGEFRGYVCRTNHPRIEQKRKYLYNDGFNKRNTLCGRYAEKKAVFLCEGYFDYLSLWTRGRIKNVCAILGWHISDGQVEELRAKNITTVVSALDNDSCGKKGTEYLKKFFDVIRFPFPEGVKDPGEMSEKQIQKALKQVREEIGKYENKN